MSSLWYPARGFFIGKGGGIAKVVLAVALLAFPLRIEADTAFPHPQSTVISAAAIPAPAPSIQETRTVWVTAYTSDPAQTSDHPLITASGGMVRDGVVAANFLPFGTKIKIPSLFGDKVFVVEDRTSQKFSGRVDIWMPSNDKAIIFGIQHATIVILDQDLALK